MRNRWAGLLRIAHDAEFKEERQDASVRLPLELRGDLSVAGVVPLTDNDVPSPGRWCDAMQFIRQRGEAVYLQDKADALGVNRVFTSRLLTQAVLSGKVRNLGHQKGWVAAG